MILRDKKNHMILWSTKCISQERIDGSNNNKKEREKLRVKRKWTIGNKTQIKRHYVCYCVFVDEIKYMRKHTYTFVTNRETEFYDSILHTVLYSTHVQFY